jgi:hypothetical protein
MRAFAITFALILGACATKPQQLKIIGRYAPRLSAEDLRQIQLVAAAGPEHLPLQLIDAFEPNRVRVEIGTTTDFVKFGLIKQKGRWVTDRSSDIKTYHFVHP